MRTDPLMPITLCFDFGNTRLKYALFDGAQIRSVEVLTDDAAATLQAVLDRHRPDYIMLSSVIDGNVEGEKVLSAYSGFHRLNHLSRLPFTTPVGKPETIGADRLALVAAAVHLFPGHQHLVIGLGSAVTYNFVNGQQAFIGGSISPGMEMRFRALEHFTAKLPLVHAHWNFPLSGYDTKTNIQSGVIFGVAKEIDGVIEAYEERYDNLHVSMTGGDAAYFLPFLKKKITIDPDLLFKGLYVISEFNR